MDGNPDSLDPVLAGTAFKNCPVCGSKKWIRPQELSDVHLPVSDGQGQTVGIEMVVALCERCGFVRMHSAAVLKGDAGPAG